MDARRHRGFHDTCQGTCYAIGPTACQEILDRLLELKHVRYAGEVRMACTSRLAKETRKLRISSKLSPRPV